MKTTVFARFVLTLFALQSLIHEAVSRSPRGDEPTPVRAAMVIRPGKSNQWKDKNAVGNARFKGHLIDVLEEIAKEANLKITLYITDDYGKTLPNGSWTGMVREVLQKRANFSGSTLAYTKQRASVVAYTAPIEYAGYTFLLKKTSFTEHIKTTKELAVLEGMHFITVGGGIMHRHLRISNIPEEKYILDIMEKEKDTSYIKTMPEGVKRLRASNGDLALVSSRATAKIHMGIPPCELKTIGSVAQIQKPSGLIVAKGSPMIKRLNKAIFAMKASGKYDELLHKWYDGPCDKQDKDKPTSGAGPATAVMFDTIVVAYLLSLAAFY